MAFIRLFLYVILGVAAYGSLRFDAGPSSEIWIWILAGIAAEAFFSVDAPAWMAGRPASTGGPRRTLTSPSVVLFSVAAVVAVTTRAMDLSQASLAMWLVIGWAGGIFFGKLAELVGRGAAGLVTPTSSHSVERGRLVWRAYSASFTAVLAVAASLLSGPMLLDWYWRVRDTGSDDLVMVVVIFVAFGFLPLLTAVAVALALVNFRRLVDPQSRPIYALLGISVFVAVVAVMVRVDYVAFIEVRDRLCGSAGRPGWSADDMCPIVPDSRPNISNVVLTDLPRSIDDMTLSPDGRILAVAGRFGETAAVRLWDMSTRQRIGDLAAEDMFRVTALAFSPDGKTIATANTWSDGEVRLWDVAKQRQIGQPIPAYPNSIYSVEFSPDGRTLVTGGDTGIRLWSVSRRTEIGPVDCPFISSCAVVPVDGKGRFASFSPNGKLLAVGGADNDNTVRLYDVAGRRQTGKALEGHADELRALAFRSDGAVLASASQDGTARLWDVSRYTQMGAAMTGLGPVTDAEFAEARRRVPGYLRKDSQQSADSVAFSPDGKLIATGGQMTIRLWDVASQRQLNVRFTGHTTSVVGLAFSLNGKTLVSADGNGTVLLWDVSTLQR